MKQLQNKKVYVGKYGKEIQEKAFELGYMWSGKSTLIQCTSCPFLYFNDFAQIKAGNDMESFNESYFEEITPEEILAIKVEKEEYKFQPFEQVLVRDYDNQTWRASLFSHYRKDIYYLYKTVSGSHLQCIPYKGNEHLLGTTNNP